MFDHKEPSGCQLVSVGPSNLTKMIKYYYISMGMGFDYTIIKRTCLKRKKSNYLRKIKIKKLASTCGAHMLSLQTPIFSGKNYECWSLTMKDLFRGKYLWGIVQNGYTKS